MSWKAAGAVKDMTEGLSRSEKLVLLLLADYHNEKTGQCNPRVGDIADDALMSVRRVQQVLTALETRGLISIEGREGGRQRPQYWLTCIGYTPEKYSPLTPEIISPLTTEEISPQGRSPLHPRGEAGFAPPTIKEPKEEPQSQPQSSSEASDPWLEIRPLFESTFGLLGGTAIKQAKEYARTVPIEWFLKALEITKAEADVPNWRYCEAILRRAFQTNTPPRLKGEKPPVVVKEGTARSQFLQRYEAAGRGVTVATQD